MWVFRYIHARKLSPVFFFLISCKSLETQKGNLWFKHRFNDKLFTHVIKQMDILCGYTITLGTFH